MYHIIAQRLQCRIFCCCPWRATVSVLKATCISTAMALFLEADDTPVHVPVRLPVPWGHVCGKAWGDPASDKPVLALHGYLDNAGSFDCLIPLLQKGLYVVSVDWPGHGLSSHRPKGSLYQSFLYIVDIKYIVDALKWEKFSILAHSMGGSVASWFAGALPDRVESMVLIESLGFVTETMEGIPKAMGRSLNSLDKLEEKAVRTYPNWDRVVDRVLEGHKTLDAKFDRSCAEIMAIRGAREVDGEYQFTRDVALKGPSLLRIPAELNAAFLASITCPTLVILGDESLIKAKTRTPAAIKNEKVKAVVVPGGHHMHMYNAEALHALVSSFLLTQVIPAGCSRL